MANSVIQATFKRTGEGELIEKSNREKMRPWNLLRKVGYRHQTVFLHEPRCSKEPLRSKSGITPGETMFAENQKPGFQTSRSLRKALPACQCYPQAAPS